MQTKQKHPQFQSMALENVFKASSSRLQPTTSTTEHSHTYAFSHLPARSRSIFNNKKTRKECKTCNNQICQHNTQHRKTHATVHVAQTSQTSTSWQHHGNIIYIFVLSALASERNRSAETPHKPKTEILIDPEQHKQASDVKTSKRVIYYAANENA